MSVDSRDGPGQKSAGQSGTALNSGSIPVADNRIDSGNLFASSREILIVHGAETYRLRLTAQNKLILTK